MGKGNTVECLTLNDDDEFGGRESMSVTGGGVLGRKEWDPDSGRFSGGNHD